jgi:signal transduction histidine kinase
MAWGSSGIFLFPIESLPHQVFLVFVIGGMVAGTTATFSVVPRAFFAFSVPALIPISVRFAVLGDDIHLAMGGMTLLFWVMMIFAARRINSSTVASLKLRFENSDLVSQLAAANEQSDFLNRTLLSEIDERKKVEHALRRSESRLRHLSTELLNAQEQERKLVAGEIHDSIGTSLTATLYKVQSVLGQIGNQSPQATAALKSLIPIIQGAINEARRIQMALRPSILDEIGILATIEWFCEQFESTYSNIAVRKVVDIREDDVSGALKTVIFRVLQEAMNNIAKHSRADGVVLVIEKTDQAIRLAIEDNGRGFDVSEAISRGATTRGLGLDSMRERTELAGGSFTIEADKGRGTIIRASWPVERPSSR